MSYFISRNGEQAPTGFIGSTIPAGAKRIVCMSSSYIAMLDALGQVNRIVAVSGIDYVSNPYILAHKDSIKDMGPEMNYELLLGLKPDIVLLYGIGDAQTAITDKLKELSIPYIYMGEYLEESPLGKAEWMVVLSELTDSREKGIEIFSEIPKRYLSLKALTESVGQCPTVMFNTPWNDSWVMPSTKSYMAQLVADAGAEYIYKENSSNSILFTGTLRENITYGSESISEEQLWNVIRAANLEEVVQKLPDGLDTMITEHGENLSGGQRQRISIARAFLRNPKILILDEATSALDSISEKKIQDSIQKLVKGRTTLIVAHRLSTIRNADRIAVIEKGNVLECGSYEELLEKKGAFYRMEKM